MPRADSHNNWPVKLHYMANFDLDTQLYKLSLTWKILTLLIFMAFPRKRHIRGELEDAEGELGNKRSRDFPDQGEFSQHPPEPDSRIKGLDTPQSSKDAANECSIYELNLEDLEKELKLDCVITEDIDLQEALDSGLGLSNELAEQSVLNMKLKELNITSYKSKPNIERYWKQDEDGDTFLHMAIIHQHASACKYLIDRAPSVNWLETQNKLQQAPLHLAVLTDQCDIINAIVTAGASLALRDFKGNTVFHLAARTGNISSLQSLCSRQTSKESTDISEPSSNKLNRKPSCDLNSVLILLNFEGMSCLHIAARNNHVDVLEYFIRTLKVPVDLPEGKSGRTVLHQAVEDNNVKLIQFLIDKCDANINAKTYEGFVAIQLAMGRKHSDAVALLLEAGADLYSK